MHNYGLNTKVFLLPAPVDPIANLIFDDQLRLWRIFYIQQVDTKVKFRREEITVSRISSILSMMFQTTRIPLEYGYLLELQYERSSCSCRGTGPPVQ